MSARFLLAASFLALLPAGAAPAHDVLHDPGPPPCMQSPDNVPGVAADGTRVAPADITPPVTAQVQSPVVIPELAGRHRRGANGTGVAIRLSGLGQALRTPRCPPPSPPPPVPVRKPQRR